MSAALYPAPHGYVSRKPAVELPPIDRAAVMREAHRIARGARQFFGSYREALAYGLGAAWRGWKANHDIQLVAGQVARRPCSAAELASSTIATRRNGASFT
jgi:hypothetical protein